MLLQVRNHIATMICAMLSFATMLYGAQAAAYAELKNVEYGLSAYGGVVGYMILGESREVPGNEVGFAYQTRCFGPYKLPPEAESVFMFTPQITGNFFDKSRVVSGSNVYRRRLTDEYP